MPVTRGRGCLVTRGRYWHVDGAHLHVNGDTLCQSYICQSYICQSYICQSYICQSYICSNYTRTLRHVRRGARAFAARRRPRHFDAHLAHGARR